MEKRVEEIKVEISSLFRQIEHENENLFKEREKIKAKCTHPEIGDHLMFVCSDCGYDGGPFSHSELSERDYENYSENIEKTRKWRRKLKAQYTREEIKQMVKEAKEKYRLLNEIPYSKIKVLSEEWEMIKSKCGHSKLNCGTCQECGWYSNDFDDILC